MIFCDMQLLPSGYWKAKCCGRIIRVRGLRSPPVRICTGAKQRKGQCSSLGDFQRLEVCQGCGGNQVKLKVFACQVHGECTIEKPLPNVKCCSACSDFSELSSAGS